MEILSTYSQELEPTNNLSVINVAGFAQCLKNKASVTPNNMVINSGICSLELPQAVARADESSFAPTHTISIFDSHLSPEHQYQLWFYLVYMFFLSSLCLIMRSMF